MPFRKTEAVIIPFAAGMDTKTDERALEPPKLAEAQNVAFDKLGGLQKRPGRTSVSRTVETDLATMTNVRGLAARKDEVLAFRNSDIYSYSEQADSWRTIEDHTTCHVEERQVAARGLQTGCDRAENGGHILRAWLGGEVDDYSATTPFGVEYAVYDRATGAIVATNKVTGTIANVRCRAVGTYLHVYYVDYASGPPFTLKCIPIDTTDVHNTIDATPVTIASDMNNAASPNAYYRYDVAGAQLSSRALIAYNNSTLQVSGQSGYTLKLVSEDGTVFQTTAKSRDSTGEIAVSVNGSRVTVARYDDTGGYEGTLGGFLRLDWILSADLSDDTYTGVEVDSTHSSLAPVTIGQIAATTAWVIYNVEEAQTTLKMVPTVRTTVCTSTDAGPIVAALKSTLASSGRLASRAVVFTDPDATARCLVAIAYAWPTTKSTNAGRAFSTTGQNQYWLLDAAQVLGDVRTQATSSVLYMGDKLPSERAGLVARFAVGEAVPQRRASVTPVYAMPQLEHATDFDAYTVSANFLLQTRAIKNVSAGTQNTWQQRDTEVREWDFDFNTVRPYRGAEAGESLYLPGGYLAQYDGSEIYEAQFWTYPDAIEHIDDNAANSNLWTSQILPAAGTTLATAGGSLTTATEYSYIFKWEHFNDRGERTLSTHAGAIQATTGTATPTLANASTKNAFLIPSLGATKKNNVVLAVYRAVNGVYYRCSPIQYDATFYLAGQYVVNDRNADWLVWQDSLYDDTEIQEFEQLTDVGVVLDNVPPPRPPQVVGAAQNRLFCICAGDDNFVYYSKDRGERESVAFNEALVASVPQGGGKLTNVFPGEDSIVLMRERGVYVASGRGADNFGTGGFGAGQEVAHGVGCVDALISVKCPAGILFKSARGFHLLDPAYSVQNMPEPEGFLDDTYIGAVYVPDRYEAIVGGNSGGSLAWNFLANQWSHWKHMTCEDIKIARGGVWMLGPTTGGEFIYYLDETTWEDDEEGTPADYPFMVETGWIPLNGLGGRVHLMWWELVGEYRDVHNLVVKVAYNGVDSWSDTYTFTGTGPTAGYAFRHRRRFGTRRATSVKFQVTDAERDATTLDNSFRLSGIRIEFGIDDGHFRLGSAFTG